MKPKIYTVSVRLEGVDFEVDYTGLGEDCVVESVHLPDSKVDLYNVLSDGVQYAAENAAYSDSDERYAGTHEEYADLEYERMRDMRYDADPSDIQDEVDADGRVISDADPGL